MKTGVVALVVGLCVFEVAYIFEFKIDATQYLIGFIAGNMTALFSDIVNHRL